MFQMLGLGEKAGSGFQKILRAWREQHWIMPFVAENPTLEMTRIFMPIASMIPEDVERELRSVVGDSYKTLNELGRVVLMLAHRFGEVGNEDIQHYRKEHPRDIGNCLATFVTEGWLEKTGHGRGTRYRWPKSGSPGLFDILIDDSEQIKIDSEHLGSSTEHLQHSSEHLNTEPEHRLREIAAVARGKGRIPKHDMELTIIKLCSDDWLSLRTLAGLLDREPDSLRNHYINPMLRDGRLQARVPGKPNHPNQSYRKKE